MSILNKEFKDKIFEIKDNENFNNEYFIKIKFFKNYLDDFNLINKLDDDFFISIYKKNFLEIIDYEIENNFFYSDKDILELESKIQDLSESNFSLKYIKILDYMVIKISDFDGPLYGTVINFIASLFDDVQFNVELINKVKNIWKEQYQEEFFNFKSFKESKEFDKIVKNLISIENDFSKFKDIIEFLMFSSQESDFFYHVQSIDDLYEGKKELYQKFGQKILLDIKNRIVSYN